MGEVGSRRALVVGIDYYEREDFVLSACAADARAIGELLRADDGPASVPWEVDELISEGRRAVRFHELRKRIDVFFSPENCAGADLLLYYAGHAEISSRGPALVTSDLYPYEVDPLMRQVNACSARTVTLILDTCVSGAIGDLPQVRHPDDPSPVFRIPTAELREGVTILTSANGTEKSEERDGRGVFTSLLASGLAGEARDLSGRITALSLYSHAASAIATFGQTPMLKTNSAAAVVLRQMSPRVASERLQQITTLFKSPDAEFELLWAHDGDRPNTYESFVGVPATGTEPAIPATDDQIALDHLKLYRNNGIATSTDGRDFYWICDDQRHGRSTDSRVVLTDLGRYIWDLVATGRLTSTIEAR